MKKDVFLFLCEFSLLFFIVSKQYLYQVQQGNMLNFSRTRHKYVTDFPREKKCRDSNSSQIRHRFYIKNK